jgi:hypothetical protein
MKRLNYTKYLSLGWATIFCTFSSCAQAAVAYAPPPELALEEAHDCEPAGLSITVERSQALPLSREDYIEAIGQDQSSSTHPSYEEYMRGLHRLPVTDIIMTKETSEWISHGVGSIEHLMHDSFKPFPCGNPVIISAPVSTEPTSSSESGPVPETGPSRGLPSIPMGSGTLRVIGTPVVAYGLRTAGGGRQPPNKFIFVTSVIVRTDLMEGVDYYHVVRESILAGANVAAKKGPEVKSYHFNSMPVLLENPSRELPPTAVTLRTYSPDTAGAKKEITSSIGFNLGGSAGAGGGGTGGVSIGYSRTISSDTTEVISDCMSRVNVAGVDAFQGTNAAWQYIITAGTRIASHTFSPVEQWVWRASISLRGRIALRTGFEAKYRWTVIGAIRDAAHRARGSTNMVDEKVILPTQPLPFF